MNLYLDVDGVLLGKRSPGDAEIVQAGYCQEFLEYVTSHFKCYWLSSHTKDGDVEHLVDIIRTYTTDADILALCRKIEPARWNTLKTESINFNAEFIWIDDQPLAAELEEMRKHGVEDRMILVDTRKDYFALDAVLLRFRRKKYCGYFGYFGTDIARLQG